jgi:HlyD family secretion protein
LRDAGGTADEARTFTSINIQEQYRMKYLILLIVVVVLAGGSYWAWAEHEKAIADATPVLQTAKVERKDVRVAVESTGAVSSNQDVDIKCQASGDVVVLPYRDVSGHVPPGALLMKIDETDEQRALDLAYAVEAADNAKLQEAVLNRDIAKMSLVTTQDKDESDLASTKAKLDDAQNKARRTKALFDQKLAAVEDLETANTTAATAEADYKSAQIAIAELEQTKAEIGTKEQEIEEMKQQVAQDVSKRQTAQQNKDYCTVSAPPANDIKDPPDWYVSAIGTNLAIGYLVQSGSSGFSGGTTVMTLSDMSHVYVLATVDESDIGRLLIRFNAGKELPVTLGADAYPGVEFHGKVVRIATKGVNTTNVVTFEVKIEVTSPNRTLLRPIMTTNCDIISAEEDNVLTVPVQAVSRHRAESEDATQSSTEASPASADFPPPSAATAPAEGEAKGKKRGHKKHDTEPDALEKPSPGTVTILKADGTTESREVVVGLSDDTSYQVISGLEEGETVVLNKNGADSKWRGGPRSGGAGGMMRGIGR